MFNARQQRFRARIAEHLEKIEDIMALKEEIREVKREIKKTSKCGSRICFGYIYFPEKGASKPCTKDRQACWMKS